MLRATCWVPIIIAISTAAGAADDDRITKLEKQVKRLQAQYKVLSTANKQLLKANQDLLDLIADLQSLERDHSKAIGDLATRNGDNYVPKIFGNMTADRDFRDEIMRTNKGTLVIQNKMKRPITFYINGGRWRIPQGEHSISVPLGTVTVHTSREIPRRMTNWSLSKDRKHYRLHVSIKPSNSVPRAF